MSCDVITLFIYADGPWRNRRRMLNPAFHHQHKFIDTFNDISFEYISKMEDMIGTVKCKEMDVFSIMSQLILNIFCGKLF